MPATFKVKIYLLPINWKPFGLLDVTHIGLAPVASSILYFIVVDAVVLPSKKRECKRKA